MNDINE
jgi:hypothetical protein